MKVGVLGAAVIARNFLDNAQIANVQVNAIYNHTIEKANNLAQEYQIQAVYEDYEQLLNEADVDTIYVGLPNSMHYEYAKKALEYGKHVLIEKPFCSNLKEFDDLKLTAENHGVYIIEMERVTCLPNFEVIKNELPNIGNVKMVTMDYSQYSRKWDSYKEGNVANVFRADFSGGALVDLGVYCINLTLCLFGKPSSLIYVADKLETGVDVSGCLVMKYPEMITSITVSKNSIGDKRTTIQGENGTLIIEDVPGVLKSVKLVTKEGTTDISAYQEYEGAAYTLMEMKRIIDNRDDAAAEIRLVQSRKVLQVLESA